MIRASRPKVAYKLTDRWRRRMLLICLASRWACRKGLRASEKAEYVKEIEERRERMRQNERQNRARIKEDERFFGYRHPAGSGIPLAAVNLLLFFLFFFHYASPSILLLWLGSGLPSINLEKNGAMLIKKKKNRVWKISKLADKRQKIQKVGEEKKKIY